jgi:anthranilate phosphoribosyltransferase
VREFNTPGAAITPAGAAPSLREAVDRARSAVDSGDAQRALERYVAATLALS